MTCSPPDGEISASDTRGVLKRVLNKAAEMGFTCYTSPEIEFYLLESSKLGADGFPVPVDHELRPHSRRHRVGTSAARQ